MRVDGALERLDLGAADRIEQLRACKHAAGPARERRNELELRGRQLDCGAVACDGHFRRVDDQIRAPEHIRMHRARLDASQHRAHARHKLPRAEGLRDIVVRAHLQPGEAIGFLNARGQHDDRNIGVVPKPLRHIETIDARQAEVEHDEIGLALVNQ